MKVNAAVIGTGLGTGRRRTDVQRPVARFPIVDTATFELRKNIEHRGARRGDEKRPERQLPRRELAALPNVARRMDDQIAAVFAIDEYELFIGNRHGTAGAHEDLHAKSL